MDNTKTPACQLATMIKLAAVHHEGQFDKGGRPYVLHVLKVMHYLKEKGDDELSAIAVGHDLIEDTMISGVDLQENGISVRVITGIMALTKTPGQPHQEYLLGVLKNFDACRVKLADLRHNTDIRRLKGIGEKDLKRIKKYHTMHMQITDMIKWYESHHHDNYKSSADYFIELDNEAWRVTYAY